jgi:hypothetical protein
MTVNEAIDFQDLIPNVNPEMSVECINEDTTTPSCTFSNTLSEITKHHDACLASNAISVELRNVVIVCNGKDLSKGYDNVTYTFTHEIDLVCFSPVGSCEPHQRTFCDEWISILAYFRFINLIQDIGVTEVMCTIQPYDSNETCTLPTLPPSVEPDNEPEEDDDEPNDDDDENNGPTLQTPNSTIFIAPVVISDSFQQCAVSCHVPLSFVDK